jgi:hypothetical protein
MARRASWTNSSAAVIHDDRPPELSKNGNVGKFGHGDEPAAIAVHVRLILTATPAFADSHLMSLCNDGTQNWVVDLNTATGGAAIWRETARPTVR